MNGLVKRPWDFSTIDQNAWVVDDLELAMRNWIDRGFGPFFVTAFDLPEVRYRGGLVPLSLKVGMARAGEVQIELIQQLNDGPSVFRDVYPAGQSGFHHVRRRPIGDGRGPSDYDAYAASLAEQGIEVVMEMPFGAQRVGYADTRAQFGCILEFYDPSEAVESMNALTASAAAGWDGTDPIRMLDLADL